MKSYSSLYQLLILILLCSCSSSDEQSRNNLRNRNQKGEYIYRQHNESLASIESPEKTEPKSYPWNKDQSNKFRKISKEYFRCKGSCLNPSYAVQIKGETVRRFDCSGSNKHSLPLRDDKEFIYPILIDLVNYIQETTQRPVVITCGHRCPEHNIYADPSPSNQYSKHMIGAEVSFYVQGLENQPQKIVQLLQDYYKNDLQVSGDKDYEEFKRYEKKDTNTAIEPWFNKEIFVKIYDKNEGRNFDNRHPYPYLSIQVRYDRETKEKVMYSWDKANRNYRRW